MIDEIANELELIPCIALPCPEIVDQRLLLGREFPQLCRPLGVRSPEQVGASTREIHRGKLVQDQAILEVKVLQGMNVRSIIEPGPLLIHPDAELMIVNQAIEPKGRETNDQHKTQ